MCIHKNQTIILLLPKSPNTQYKITFWWLSQNNSNKLYNSAYVTFNLAIH